MMKNSLVLLLVLVSSLLTISALNLNEAYGGTLSGQNSFASCRFCSRQISLPNNGPYGSFEVFNSYYNNIFVNDCGVLSVFEDFFPSGSSSVNAYFVNYADLASNSIDRPVFAAFWADSDIRNYGRVYYRTLGNSNWPSGLSKNIIDDYFSFNFNIDFGYDYRIIATWDRVPYFNNGVDNGGNNARNTYQAVVYVDNNDDGFGQESDYTIVCFNYKVASGADLNWLCGSLDSKCANGNRPGSSTSNPLTELPRVGFTRGNGNNVFKLPYSETVNAKNLETKMGNIDTVGQWCYRVDAANGVQGCQIQADCFESRQDKRVGVTITPADLDEGSNCYSPTDSSTYELSRTSFSCNSYAYYKRFGNIPVTLTIRDSDSCSTPFRPRNYVTGLNCPSQESVTTSTTDCTGTTVTWEMPTPTADCPGYFTASITTPGITNGGKFPLGTTAVTLVANGDSGSSATCTFNVVVNDGNVNAAICKSGVIDVHVTNAGATTIVVADLDNGSTKMCDVTPSVSGKTSYTCADIRNTDYSATLTVGASTCQSTSIRPYGDITSITCPDDFTVYAEDCSSTQISWDDPTVVSDCPAQVTISSDQKPGAFYGIGDHKITLTATLGRKTKDCSFTVTISGDPLLGPHKDVILDITKDECTTKVFWIPPVILNVCSTYTISSNKQPNIDIFAVPSTTEVTYTLSDNEGQQDTTTFNVIVNDKFPPEIVCPSTIEADADSGICTTTVEVAPTKLYDCDKTNLKFVTDHTTPSEKVYDVGTYDGYLTATDNSQNTAQCAYKVIVHDKQKPIITGCTNNIGDKYKPVSADTNCVAGTPCTTAVTFTTPSATDNCKVDSVLVTSGPNSGDKVGFGVFKVQFTATDVNTNTEYCEFEGAVIGIQVESPSGPINQNTAITFKFNYYLPGDTKATFKVINGATDRAIKSVTVNLQQGLSSGTYVHTFSSTSAPGTYYVKMISESGVNSVANPIFTVCPPGGCAPGDGKGTYKKRENNLPAQ